MTIQLHPYQALDLERLQAMFLEEPHVAVFYCTGAGKTMTALALVALASPAFSHVVVVAPTTVIRDQFTRREFIFRGNVYSTPEVNETDINLVGLGRYLELAAPGHLVRVTNQLVGQKRGIVWLEALIARRPRFAEGRLLILDEAHRAGDGLMVTRFRDLWISAGGKVLSLTATPDRSDRLVAIPPQVPYVSRSMLQQMEDGYAPSRLVSEAIHIPGVSSFDSDASYVPVDFDEMARHVSSCLHADGDPKAIIRLKGMGSREEHEAAIVKIASALGDRRVFIASTHALENERLRECNRRVISEIRSRTGRALGGDISEVLAYEAHLEDAKDSVLDVIIGMQSVVEGLDWPLCSHLYLAGVPRALLPLVQGIGRTMRGRSKLAGYDPTWADASKVVLFVASENEKVKEDLKARHVEELARVACYLASFREWSILGSLSAHFASLRSARLAEGGATPTAIEEQIENTKRQVAIATGETPEWEKKKARIQVIRVEAKNFFVNRVEMQRSLDDKSRIGGLPRWARMVRRYIEVVRKEDADITVEDIERVLLASLPAAKARFRKHFERASKERKDIVEAVKEAMDAVRKDYVELPYNEPEAAVVDAVSDTFENLMTPAREPPKPLQTITLDAKSIRTIHEQMEHAHAGESAVARGYRDLRTP